MKHAKKTFGLKDRKAEMIRALTASDLDHIAAGYTSAFYCDSTRAAAIANETRKREPVPDPI